MLCISSEVELSLANDQGKMESSNRGLHYSLGVICHVINTHNAEDVEAFQVYMTGMCIAQSSIF